MVFASSSDSCNCRNTYTGTSCGSSGNYYGATTSTAGCGCCQGYRAITLTASNVPEIEEEVVEQNIIILCMSNLVRTIFYKLLIFAHYVECRARAPPVLI